MYAPAPEGSTPVAPIAEPVLPKSPVLQGGPLRVSFAACQIGVQVGKGHGVDDEGRHALEMVGRDGFHYGVEPLLLCVLVCKSINGRRGFTTGRQPLTPATTRQVVVNGNNPVFSARVAT